MSVSIGPASTRRPALPTRREALYGPCDMYHGLDPDSPTRPCGYGDPMMTSPSISSPRAPAASVQSALAMTDGPQSHCRSLRP